MKLTAPALTVIALLGLLVAVFAHSHAIAGDGNVVASTAVDVSWSEGTSSADTESALCSDASAAFAEESSEAVYASSGPSPECVRCSDDRDCAFGPGVCDQWQRCCIFY